jgi:hypothetical protein
MDKAVFGRDFIGAEIRRQMAAVAILGIVLSRFVAPVFDARY